MWPSRIIYNAHNRYLIIYIELLSSIVRATRILLYSDNARIVVFTTTNLLLKLFSTSSEVKSNVNFTTRVNRIPIRFIFYQFFRVPTRSPGE